MLTRNPSLTQTLLNLRLSSSFQFVVLIASCYFKNDNGLILSPQRKLTSSPFPLVTLLRESSFC
jgi:hypothetical protein